MINKAGTVASVAETGRRMPFHSKRILLNSSKKDEENSG